jgi:hypothetical protein
LIPTSVILAVRLLEEQMKGVILAALWVAFSWSAIAGCCSEDAVEVSPAPVRKPVEPAVTPPPPSAGAPVDEQSAKEIVAAGSDEENPEPVAEEAEGDKLSPTDILYAMKSDEIRTKLDAAGWKVEEKTKKIKGGVRYHAAQGDARVRITWQEFKDNAAADKTMFKAEKNKNASIGRMDTRMVVVAPTKGESRSMTAGVLKVIMSPAPDAPPPAERPVEEVVPADPDGPPGPDGHDGHDHPTEPPPDDSSTDGEGNGGPNGDEPPEDGEQPASDDSTE